MSSWDMCNVRNIRQILSYAYWLIRRVVHSWFMNHEVFHACTCSRTTRQACLMTVLIWSLQSFESFWKKAFYWTCIKTYKLEIKQWECAVSHSYDWSNDFSASSSLQSLSRLTGTVMPYTWLPALWLLSWSAAQPSPVFNFALSVWVVNCVSS